MLLPSLHERVLFSGPAMDFYRPPTSRRDSDRSPDYTGDRFRDPRDRDRDRDRNERPRNRDSNERHPPSRDREPIPPPRRNQAEQGRAQDDAARMSSEKAVGEVAKLQRQLIDVLVDKVTWTIKKKAELKGFEKRQSDLNGRCSQYPAVYDALRRHQLEYKKQEAEFDKAISKTDSRLHELSENYGSLMVKHLPVGEIKTRQLIDDVKAESAKELKSNLDNRFQELEQQLASLQGDQTSQAADLSNLRKENSELRTQNGQMQLALSSRASQDHEIETLKQEKGDLAFQVLELQTQVAGLVKRIDSQQADITSLQQTKSQLAPDVPDVALRHDFKAMEQRVNELDNQLSSFDATEYTEAMDKLLGYPCWKALDSSICSQQTELQRLHDEFQGLQNSVADAKELQHVKDSIVSNKVAHEESIAGFSSKIVESVANMVSGVQSRAKLVEGRVKILEDREATTMPRATSIAGAVSPQSSSSAVNGNDFVAEPVFIDRVEAVESATKAHQNELNNLRNKLNDLRNDVEAHETMVESLDDQFNNMTTSEMAQIILEHISRLLPARSLLDMQNFHERLFNLEASEQKRTTDEKKTWDWGLAFVNELETSTKRSLTDDEASNLPQKRQRLEGLNGAANELDVSQHP